MFVLLLLQIVLEYSRTGAFSGLSTEHALTEADPRPVLHIPLSNVLQENFLHY